MGCGIPEEWLKNGIMEGCKDGAVDEEWKRGGIGKMEKWKRRGK